MQIDETLTPADLLPAINRLFELACAKVRAIDKSWDPAQGTPVFTIEGQYTTRGWTEWTQGFQYGCPLLCFDATDDRELLELGRTRTLERMAPHVTHMGVHDHGFNNISTYGNLRRLMLEGRIAANEWELGLYEMAIKASGAVQAMRWSGVAVREPSPHAANSTALGYIYSFNGPHSLFIDTLRTTRSLGLAWQLGHVLMHENDKSANLLKRSVLHGLCTNQFIVCHGDTEHAYDVNGRTAHEGVFNRNDGSFRTRATQQGYSPFSTWTRGLAWAMCGYAEELEFIASIDPAAFQAACGLAHDAVMRAYEDAACATCDHYLSGASASDGIPYWDDGAPNLHKLGDWRDRAAEPFNDHEPVDSSAAAIAAQGLIRLGAPSRQGGAEGERISAQRSSLQGRAPMAPPYRDGAPGSAPANHYLHAGLTIARTLLDEPYLSTNANHQGLLLHSVYHRPNGWDHVPKGRKVPCGESSMWGDYHLLELALLIKRMAEGGYVTFFDA
ncbi:MAG: glycosyl hydrolase [Phycisphaeraceae bacterium]